ncbi:hypothetical protein GCM10027053_52000 [Intrasporangium mesophilum]
MTTTALARKFRVDVTADLTLAGGWVELKGIYALKPTVDANTVETGAYDTDGWDSFEITGNAWGVTASVFRRTVTGVYDPGQELARARIGGFGDAARVGIRFYDKNGGPEAYQGVAIVKWERANDGVKDVDAATITFMGDGVRNTITNPGTAATAPMLLSALPSGAAAGAQVTITGSGFTGTTGAAGVKFGANNASSYVIVSDQVIVAIMPAGTAGPANVVVTNGVGASTALAYTRA